LALLSFSTQNIDRLVSFYRASLKTGKIFAIDFYTANILGCLKDYAMIPYPSKNMQTSEFSSLIGFAGE